VSDPVQSAAKTRELADGVVQVFLPLPFKPTIINVYLVRAGKTWTLVDTGMHTGDSRRTFAAALAEHGIAPTDVTRIVCTHHHIDHYGTSGPYRELTHAEVLLHPLEAERAAATSTATGESEAWNARLGIPAVAPEKRMPSPSLAFGTLYVPAVPDGLLADGDEIPLGDGRRFEVVWTPGHTPGHCCLLLQPDGILFVGDHLLPKITPHVGVAPGSTGNHLADFLDSQRKVQQFDVDLVLPAHGGVFPDHRHRANQIIQHHRVRLQDMVDIVRHQSHTAYDIARRAFAFDSDSPLTYQFPATFETLAHLEYLRHAGDLTSEERDDRVSWRAA
jgi:glyoxylase-like metal-dependent hydrolase (beta-lactamase superfamily II)